MRENVPEGYKVEENFDLFGFCGLVELVKAGEAAKKGDDDKYAYVAGIFSADTKDLDGEVLDQDGVAEGLRKYFAKLNCQVDWEHGYGQTKDPDTLIGECLRFEPRIIKKNGKRYRAHWGHFRLFKKKALAKKVLDHLDAGGKIGASIHGLKLAASAKGRVNKVMITRISLTPNPVNSETSIERYGQFMKSLTAQAGAAITPEDLEGDAKKKLYGRVKGLARNFMEQGLSGQETKKALVSYFDEQLTKGELTMDDLKQAAVDLSKALEAETPETVEAKTEDEKTAMTLLEKTFARFGYKLVKAKADDNKEGEEEGEDEEEAYEKAVTFIKGLGREALLKMGKAADILEKMKGKGKDDMAGYLTKHLGKSGTVALAKKYQKACKSTVDTELATEDEKLIKAWEAEEAGGLGGDETLDAEIGEEEVSVVSDESYQRLVKAVNGLKTQVAGDQTRYDEPLVGLSKAVQVLLKKQKEDRAMFKALCKAIRLPGFDRMALVSSTAKAVDGAQVPQGADNIRPQVEVERALRKAVEEGGGKITASQVAVARSRARRGAPLPEPIDNILFPAAAA